MNGSINQRFCIAFYSLDDGGHCDSDFVSKQKEAINTAKRELYKQHEKFKCVLYAEISNMLNPNTLIRVDLFEVGDHIRIWDTYCFEVDGKWQGGYAYGIIQEINGMEAKIQYNDIEHELIEENLSDLKFDERTQKFHNTFK